MRKKCKKVIDKADAIRDYLNNNPSATYKDISANMGIPISTVHRIVKNNHINKVYDLRKKKDKINSIMEEIYK